eukprot:TRINITY_DN4619_c0_g1_i4.p4 TRINITY_DN4619_c0_g1~~TRINITY_DN4619_c0_g1_i4.p4  ORF type:complete len:118 (-),score=8.07 TRINITY_DN4619_c0_g1_i4:16-369(-)
MRNAHAQCTTPEAPCEVAFEIWYWATKWPEAVRSSSVSSSRWQRMDPCFCNQHQTKRHTHETPGNTKPDKGDLTKNNRQDEDRPKPAGHVEHAKVRERARRGLGAPGRRDRSPVSIT